MTKKQYNISLDQLESFASDLAKQITAPLFIGLSGEMGAGKTTFTQALVNKIFNKEEIVNSPTFSIVNLYEHNDIHIVHADLFRLETYDDLVFSGIEEYLFGSDSIVIAEWYRKIDFDLPTPHLLIDIQMLSETERQFTVIQKD